MSKTPYDISVDIKSHRFKRASQNTLENVSLGVKPNEFVSIIGPSGCGKSTLLYMIAGFVKPSDGNIFHGDSKIEAPSAQRGMIFQSDAVFPWLTVWGNIQFGLKEKKLPREERDAITRKYISLVGLDGFEKYYPKELSGGMRKRVDIARVFANVPDILLMDESFGSLDHQTKELLQLELLKLCKIEQKTVVFITHDIEEAIFLGDRIMVMGTAPSSFVEEIRVPFEKPRELELKVTPEFQKLRRKLMDLFASFKEG